MRSEIRIGDAAALRLADELAGLTGESIESAVVVALSERLDRARARAAWLERVMAITRDVARDLHADAAD